MVSDVSSKYIEDECDSNCPGEKGDRDTTLYMEVKEIQQIDEE